MRSRNMHEDTQEITDIILKAASKARRETRKDAPKLHTGKSLKWPIKCTIGPGLEGAIACGSKIGYVDGTKGWLIYRGYDIFDLCAYSSYEEVSYLLLHGALPNAEQLEVYRRKLIEYRHLNKTLRMLMSFPVEEMNAMGALRMGTIFMRQEFTYKDQEAGRPNLADAISADEDSIPMETQPTGEKKAVYEFRAARKARKRKQMLGDASGLEACYHLLGGVPTITAAIARIRQGHMAIEPDSQLSHAGNFLYMMTGKRPTATQERIMDIALILHADHGMNASTFASMVVASTLSDIYFSVGSGIAALSGPLHGGANEQVLRTLEEIGSPGEVSAWVEAASGKKKKIPGFGHRVYKAYDPRARVLEPLAGHQMGTCPEEIVNLYETANELEKQVLQTFGHERKIFPNVDFYSGIVYSRMGIDPSMFTPIFAVSRVAGWTARVLEYLENNRIFRPRSMYTGDFEREYVPLERR